MSISELNAVILQRIDLTPDLFILRAAPEKGEIPSFQPGQFTVLGLPGSSPRCSGSTPEKNKVDPDKLIKRAYSIASSPLTKDYLEFYLTLVKEGALTPRLACLKVGDRLHLGSKISGNFVMTDLPEKANVVMVATGTGIAPYVSMLQTYLSGVSQKFALFHGVRESIDLGYKSEMLELEKTILHFSYHPIISRPQNEKKPWNGPTGHVQSLWLSGVLEKRWGFRPTPENTHVFLCGSPAMIESMIELLAKEGFKEYKKSEPGEIHVERYW